MMDMSMGMNLLPQQQMKASPALIALNNMLVLSSLELQQLVQQELEENPALDQVESEEDHPIADYLVGSLDEHGFLDGSVEEIATMMHLDAKRIEHILLKLQELGP